MKTLDDPNSRTEIAERLKKLTPDSPRQWGKMTPNQMICHLSDAFRTALNQRTVKSIANPFSRTVMKYFALYAPLRWPHGLPTMPENDQMKDGTPPDVFHSDRAELLRLLNRFCDPSLTFEGVSHPLFGNMSATQWRRWAYLHMDHHLRQFGV